MISRPPQADVVSATRQSLDALDGRPTPEHPECYDNLHLLLVDALTDPVHG